MTVTVAGAAPPFDTTVVTSTCAASSLTFACRTYTPGEAWSRSEMPTGPVVTSQAGRWRPP